MSVKYIKLGCGRFTVLMLVLLTAATSCASRPPSSVLQPISLVQNESGKITLLAITNRNQDSDGKGFGSRWAAKLTYEKYRFSVPSERKSTAIVYPSKNPDPRREFVVTAREKLSEKELVEDATSSANFDGTVAVFVHGYNYSYQEALFRTAQMAADADTLSPPILFSWPSAASYTGYVTDRDAALYSRGELERIIGALATDRRVKRIVLFGHSMGGFLSMEAAAQLKLQGRRDVMEKLQIVLAAPDIDVDVFRSQLRDLGRLKSPITLLVSKTDGALTISSVIGGERPRIGRLDINDPLVRDAAIAHHVNIIDVGSVESSDGLGHDRYAALARFSGELRRAEAQNRGGGNVGALVFQAAGAVVASPFKVAEQIVR
ncbi:alpha/beta hydrolase [Agrobacterium sp. rho-13.3]|uniref:alpha/beta hydrolase n=1 Tax=Agrobacterium sp. rho-13.3 TaxID=3072980 RepID=UPI002A1184E3|nr:alpha/beta fold hydrolase [Agrobacterium sp. rho-13.3]MDX8306807.1 alpha/beta fold hydrolase [Agrobacterium sp. rho-13.3]MDX8306862.1 alpha/beta fold hydrolase [Agrobacterium sp. rho-13.3]